ncbi:hypothetical protein Trydic_g7472 [Trypoxylus dichotomus]
MDHFRNTFTLNDSTHPVSHTVRTQEVFDGVQRNVDDDPNALINFGRSSFPCKQDSTCTGIEPLDHYSRCKFGEWAEGNIASNPQLHLKTLFSDKAHFWLNIYTSMQNCHICSDDNPQAIVETPLHPEKVTV